MKKFWEKTRQFIRDEEGQSTAEYVLILAIVVMLVMKFRDTFTTSMGRATNSLGNKMESIVNDLDNY